MRSLSADGSRRISKVLASIKTSESGSMHGLRAGNFVSIAPALCALETGGPVGEAGLRNLTTMSGEIYPVRDRYVISAGASNRPVCPGAEFLPSPLVTILRPGHS